MSLGVKGTFTLKEDAPDCSWVAIFSSLTAIHVDRVAMADMTSLSVGSGSSSVIKSSDETGFASG